MTLDPSEQRHVMSGRIAAFLIVAIVGTTVGAADPPPGWTFETPRAELAARHWVERAADGPPVLGLAGRGDRNVDGRWVKRVPVTAGKYYVFAAPFRARDV